MAGILCTACSPPSVVSFSFNDSEIARRELT